MFEVHDGDKVYNRVDITDKDIEDFIDSFDNKQLELILTFFTKQCQSSTRSKSN